MKPFYIDVWDINQKPISADEALTFVQTGSHGATAFFLGTVRDMNLGRKVLGVSYDAHSTLAIESFRKICQEAQQQWGNGLKLYIVHAKGRLNVGSASIVISASSPHRDEAFKACRYVIEEIKHRTPVWKQEHYVNGDSEWVQGHALCAH